MNIQRPAHKKKLKSPCIEITKTATYKIGKTKAIVDGVFRQDSVESISTILARLIAEDAKKLHE
ncbi:MAG: hypothetical protein GX800_11095 [Clostridiaceae bacterium]|nr:hypothetical protein [Clostridiaceae bacterium]